MRSAAQDGSVESLVGFNRLHNTSPTSVGFIADALLRLNQTDIPVLSGCVVSATSFQHFCRSITWSSPFLSDFPHLSLRLQPEQPFQLQAVADEIYQGITQTPLPTEWLHRSLSELEQIASDGWRLSLSLAMPQPWTGRTTQMLRMLPIRYCPLASVDSAIRQTWASVFTASTLLLMQEQAMSIDRLRLGLLVQPVGLTKASGFLQVTESHLFIQATYGLSEGLLRGEVLPDRYIFDRQTQDWQREAGVISSTYQVATESSPQACHLGVCNQELDPTRLPPFVLNDDQLSQLLVLAATYVAVEDRFAVIEWMLSAEDELKVVSLWPETPFPLSKRTVAHDIEQPKGQASPILQGLTAAVGRVTASIVICKDRRQIQSQQVKDKIVVLDQVKPEDWVWLQDVAGLICTTGGYTSHGAIMARELGLPAIVGASSALERLQSDQRVVLDGTQGTLYEAIQSVEIEDGQPLRSADGLVQSTKTQLWVNLSQPKLLPRALVLPVEGVGLLRSEWFFLEICQGQLPVDWLRQHSDGELVNSLCQHLRPFVQAWFPRPVFYRSFDNKQNGRVQKSSPVMDRTVSPLGLRGASYYLEDSTLFDIELRALAELTRSGNHKLRLIVPFVRTVEEFVFCRDRIQAAGLLDRLQVWMMAEVPSVLFQLPDYVAAGVQGIAIGTNDLTQLLLGVSRDDATLSQRYAADHPAVVAAMSQLVKTAQSLKIPCSICGQAPVQSPHLIDQFVEWGVTGISVDMASVAEMRGVIAKAEDRLRSATVMPSTPATTQNG